MKYIEHAASFWAPEDAEWNELRTCEIVEPIQLHPLVSALTKAGKIAGHLTPTMKGHHGTAPARLPRSSE